MDQCLIHGLCSGSGTGQCREDLRGQATENMEDRPERREQLVTESADLLTLSGG